MTGQSMRCRFCGRILPAWVPVQRKYDGAVLLHHFGQSHPTEVGRFLDQMHTTDDVASVSLQAFDPVVEIEEGA